MKLPYFILLALLVILAGQWLYFYPQLPPKIAVHFNALGQPDSWSTKQQFAWFFSILTLSLTAVFAFLPASLEKLPNSQINLPNKDYWLDPARRTATFAFIKSQLAWFGAALLALLVFALQLVINANLSREIVLSNTEMVAALIIFLLFVVIWLVRLLSYFYRKH